MRRRALACNTFTTEAQRHGENVGDGRNGCPRSCFLGGPVYHVFVHQLAQRVLGEIRQQELLKAGERVGVAVSGGIDSVALLRLLLELRGELGIVLSVVHFNHRLRGAESDEDERFVAGLAREHDLEFYVGGEDVGEHAREEGVSVETAARELRYGFFRDLLGEDRKGEPQGLKPASVAELNGAAKAVPLHEPSSLREASDESSHMVAGHLNTIVTGHTLDDQAETVLMRLIRGAGLKGLGGIYPRIVVEDGDGEFCGEIVRPLLGVRRRELEAYLREIGQMWREDATNSEEKFTRNRVRRLVVPLLEKEFNPAVTENLAELAEIARGEEDYWENEVAGWMGTGVHWSEPAWARAPDLVQIGGGAVRSGEGDPQRLKPLSSVPPDGTAKAVPCYEPTSPDAAGAVLFREPASLRSGSGVPLQEKLSLREKIENASWLVMNASVDRLWFLGEPVAVQRRLVKAIGERAGIPLEFRHVEEILRLAGDEGASGKEISLPLGWKVVRKAHELLFVTPDLRQGAPPRDYEYELRVPGEVAISEIGAIIEVRRVSAGGGAYNPEHLLDADALPGRLKVRNWRAGDRFWPAHTKSPKKVKELLQERQVAQPERSLWPVVVSGDEIVWMRGFSLPARLQAKPGSAALAILEKKL